VSSLRFNTRWSAPPKFLSLFGAEDPAMISHKPPGRFYSFFLSVPLHHPLLDHLRKALACVSPPSTAVTVTHSRGLRTHGLPQKVDFHTLASAPCPISSPSTGRTMPPASLTIFVELISWECDIFGHHAPLAVGLVRVTRLKADVRH